MKKSVKLKPTDRLILPEGLTVKEVDDKFVVLSPETGNWIVLDNKAEVAILSEINGKPIGDMIEGENSEIARKVITLLLAREFAGINETVMSKYELKMDGMQIYLTHGCNLRCKHCYMYAGKASDNEMNVEQWKAVLQAFKDNGGKNVTMSGGEVMQFKGFPELVEYAHNLGLETLIYTNGILWTESLIQRLAPYISSVQVSIDGYNEETNSVIRGKNNFDKACDAVVAFVKYGVEVKVATTFIFDNITDDIESKYKAFTESLNKRAGRKLEYHLTKSLIKGRNVDYTKEQNKQISELMLSVQDTISPNSEYTNFIEGHEPNILEKSCGYGKPTVDSNGDVYLCSTIEYLKPIGNVLEESLPQLLHKAKSYRVLNDVEHLEECKGCDLRYICNGGCRLENGTITNHIYKRDKCTEKFKRNLLKQMKDSFIYYFKI